MRPQTVFPRRGQAKLVVLLVLFVVLLVLAFWLWSRPSSQPGLDAGQAVAESFLTELREGHIPQAWESTTAEFKSAQGKEAFTREVKPVKFLKDAMDFVSVQTVSVGNQARSEYLFRAKSGETVRIVLGREDGNWKVDRWMR